MVRNMLKRVREILHALRVHIHVLTWVRRLVEEYRFYLLGLILLYIAQTLMGIYFSVMVKRLIDTASNPATPRRFALFALVFLGWSGLMGLLGYLVTLYREKILFNMRKQVFHAVLRADWMKIGAFSEVDLNSRISGDAAEITEFVCVTFPLLVGALAQLAVTAGVVYFINRKILAVLILGAVLSAALMLGFRLHMKPLSRTLRERDVAANAYQTESCGKLLVTRSFCAEEVGERRFIQLQQSRLEAIRNKEHFSFVSNTALNFFFDAGYLLVFGWAILNLGRRHITYGMLSMLIALEGYIQGPINRFASALPDFVRMLVSADRLNELTEMECEEPETAENGSDSPLGVTVEGLRFSYPEREQELFGGFSCTVRPGSFTVLTGVSGCGKTTLLHLLMGLLTPQEGVIRYTTASGESVPVGRAARQHMGYVPQGNTLFHGSILDNVCFAGEEQDEAAAREALRIADALAFVDALPEGIHSKIQEQNGGLSVGQAQRIALARALYKHPALLILDEATSALDRQTERDILRAIHDMPERPTVLCVTHRQQALEYCDQVIALNGKEGEGDGLC